MTSADLLNWYTNGDFEFVPAPTSSQYILPVTTVYQFYPSGTPYATSGAQVKGWYGNSGTGLQVTENIVLSILEQTESSYIYTDDVYYDKAYAFLYSDSAGRAIVGSVDEPLTTGNGSMTITTYYFLRDIQPPS